MSGKRACFQPLNAISIHPAGQVTFCTSARTERGVDPIDERRGLHQALLLGEWPQACRACEKKEVAGVASRRIKAMQAKSSIYGEAWLAAHLAEQKQPELRHLEVAFSNVCNLRCAMCSSEFSSSWMGDDARARSAGLEFREFTRSYQGVQRLSGEKMDDLIARAGEIDIVLIKGGEPTREPLCFEFLRRLREARGASMPTIYIQSNGTRAPVEWLPLLSGQAIELGISIDGWGHDYEWIRQTSFSNVLENTRALDRAPEVIKLKIDFTLSVFNLLHLPVFLQQVLELKRELPKLAACALFQWAQEPYANPTTIRHEVRQEIMAAIAGLINANADFFPYGENLLRVLDLPNAKAVDVEKTRRWIGYLGATRGSLFELQPRLAQSLIPSTL